MNIYCSSDWHVGHKNILTFCKWPYTHLDHMHRVLINNYNSTVNEEDTCYFLGDMGLKQKQIEPVIRQLNGTKILILGNHDRNPTYMKNCGFDVVSHGVTLWHGGVKITMSHCPLPNVPREDLSEYPDQGDYWYGDKRPNFKPYICTDEIQDIHLHGHIHSPNNGKSQPILGKQMDVGVDANTYRPISLDRVVSLMR